MSEDRYLQACINVAPIIIKLNKSKSLDEANNLSSEIINIVLSCDPRINDDKYVNAYLNAVMNKKRLNARFTNVSSMKPQSVCCALFGLWSAVPALINMKIIGDNRDQVKINSIINFCWDLLDVILPDGIDNVAMENNKNESE